MVDRGSSDGGGYDSGDGGGHPPCGGGIEPTVRSAGDTVRSAGNAVRSAGDAVRSVGNAVRSAVAPVARSVRSTLDASGLPGIAADSAHCCSWVAAYPLVLARRAPDATRTGCRTESLPLARRSVVVTEMSAQEAVPVLLVHGLPGERSMLRLYRRALRRQGLGTVHAVSFRGLAGDIRIAAHQLREHVRRLREAAGAPHVHVVAHSAGGMIARYLVQRLDGDRMVRTLTTLGSPHAGSATAHVVPTELARQLTPGAELVTELAEPARGCGTRFLVVWSRSDQFMVPREHARLDHPDLRADTLEVNGVGHLSLPVHPPTAHWVADRIARSETELGPLNPTARRRSGPLSAVRTDSRRVPMTVR